MVSIPATWHTLASVLGGDVGSDGGEGRASLMGGEKASEHVTVDKLAHPLCHFTCKETNPERGGHWPKVTQLVMAEPGLEPRSLSC